MRNIVNVIMKTLWICTILSSIFGILIAIAGNEQAQSVMQQNYYTNIAIAFTVIPYLICRMLQMIFLHDDAIKK